MKKILIAMIISLLLITSCGTTVVTTTVTTAVTTAPYTSVQNTATTAAPATTAPVVTTTLAATTAPTPTATPTPAPSLTPTAPVKTPPATPSGPYTGPLFDTHIHFEQTLLTSRFTSANALLDFLGGQDVDWAIGFYLHESTTPASNVSTIIQNAAGSIIPLFHYASWSQFFSSEQLANTVLQQNLKPQGLHWGVGEIALYSDDLQSVTFNTPAMQAVFRTVNAQKGVVMIHLSTANMGGRATELSEIEPAVRDYPDAAFLFHGRKEDMKLVAQLMDNYANVYFTIDANDSIFTSKLTGYNLLYPEDESMNNAQHFLADIKELGAEALVQNGLDNLMTMLETYPDRVLWGTDLTFSWHFDESVFEAVIGLSRAVIGQLPAELQEKYAYKNAQAVFGRLLATNP